MSPLTPSGGVRIAGSLSPTDLAKRAQVSCGRRLAVQVVASERVDVRVRDRGDAAERLVVGDDVGVDGVEVLDRGGHVPGVPDLDGVDEDLEAERSMCDRATVSRAIVSPPVSPSS